MINKTFKIHLSLNFELKPPINNGNSGASLYKKDICHVFAKILLFQTNLVTKKNNSIKRNTPL